MLPFQVIIHCCDLLFWQTPADVMRFTRHFGPSAPTPLLSYRTIDIPPSSYLWMVLMTFSAEITKPIGLCRQAEVASIIVDIDIT
jgi:hypothetical protein